MGYYVSNIIGIRTGGVFSGETDLGDLKARIERVRDEVIAAHPNIEKPSANVVDGALSRELHGNKGSYVVIAGVFNYWTYDASSQFVAAVSKEFRTEVLHLCWNEETDDVQCQIWLDGRPLLEVAENPIGRILRRVG